MTDPFLTRPPPDVPFASAHNACVHVFTSHHDPATHRGRWQPVCFAIHNQMPLWYVDAHRKEAGAIDAIHRAHDGFPVAPVSVFETISRGNCCAHDFANITLLN